MAVDFGNTIMEGSIEPSVRVQQPVQDDSEAVLANGLAPAAKTFGGILGGIFKNQQEDAGAKFIARFDNELINLSNSVSQGELDPQSAMIRARALYSQYQAQSPGLVKELRDSWSFFSKESGLGHVIVEDTPEKKAMDNNRQKAAELGYTLPEYEQVLAKARELQVYNDQISLNEAQGKLITSADRTKAIQLTSQLASITFPSAQRRIEDTMAQIRTNPANKAALVEALNMEIGNSLSAIQSTIGANPDAGYIIEPVTKLLDTFNKWASGSVSNEILTNQIKNTELQYKYMYSMDPDLAQAMATSSWLNEVGLADILGTKAVSPETVSKMLGMRLGDTNVLTTDDDTSNALIVFKDSVGQAVGNKALSEASTNELNESVRGMVDSVYYNERRADDAMSYKNFVNMMGSPELKAWVAAGNSVESQYNQQVVQALQQKYETELLPAINNAWVGTQSISMRGDPTSDGQTLTVPMSEIMTPRWNGTAVEFVVNPRFANVPAAVALVNDANTGDSSIAIPLNRLINAYSVLTGEDGGSIYEARFAESLFGTSPDTESGNAEAPEPSTVPESDADLDLASFNPSELVVSDVTPIRPELALSSAGGFVEPTNNPDVRPQVLAKFSGRRLPVSIRNNNMGAVSIVGDIDSSWAAKQPGFVGTTPRPANEGGYYAKYATPEHGVAAASKLLELYGNRGINTASAIVRKWSVDRGAHNSYQNTLVKYLKEAGFNVDANTPLDLSNPAVRVAVLKAKSSHESGAGTPVYSDHVFNRGVGLGG